MKVGANYLGDGRCEFTVWAPFARRVSLQLVSPEERTIPMEQDDRGYWRTTVQGIAEDTIYRYGLDQHITRPDPASRHQPHGVHEGSRIVNQHSFAWHDAEWKGAGLSSMVMYELHVGTFTPEGTFDAIIPRLDALKDAGISAIELMPIAQFSGERNWGYDGVYPYAAQHSYGGPEGLKRLVDACHAKGLAVILDVVYNHLGPEGNYLTDFGPYFTDKYKTPWGKAVNFDGPYSDEVRNFFIENSLMWFGQYHIDALRLDAVHAIYDMSARPFLQELSSRVRDFSMQQGREFLLIAESNLNDTRTITSVEEHGHGCHAQWLDDFHHCVHTLLTNEQDGYYADYGDIRQLAKCLREGYVYSGEYSRFRKRRHGNASTQQPASRFVVFTKNHDQIGNRMRGERMSRLVSFEGTKLHAAITLLSPYIPLIFMGEEYAESAPFKYFVSHSDRDLIEAVRNGRRKEFESFVWEGDLPDPQSEEEFRASKLDWSLRTKGNHKIMLEFYRRLLFLRKETAALAEPDNKNLVVTVHEPHRVLSMRRWRGSSTAFLLFNFDEEEIAVAASPGEGVFEKVMDSSGAEWRGPGEKMPRSIRDGDHVTMTGRSVAVFVRKHEGEER